MTRARLARVPLSIALGVTAGISITLLAAALGHDPARNQTIASSPAPPRRIASQPAPRGTKVLLAWAAGGLPAGTSNMLEHKRGVIEATTVLAGLDWLKRSHASDGAVVDRPPRGYAIPIEMAYVDPQAYRSFVSVTDRQAIETLRPGQILLARTEATLRHAGEGLTIEFRDRSARVAGVVSDQATQGYEALATGELPRT
ncbi:MAG: hypothetical protein M3290_01615, partial [Actinomycetota bacterium]|nr:hypothetical protein [Actinomycetota bacterium]